MNIRAVSRQSVAALVALFVAFAALLIAPVSAHALPDGVEQTADGKLLYTKGHIDLFNVNGTSAGVTLNTKEDVTGSHVPQNPANIIVGVKDEAKSNATANLPGVNTGGYLLPSVQNHSIVWPGWDTLGAINNFEKAVYHFEGYTGPGDAFLIGSGTFGGPQPRLDSGSYKIAAGDTFTQTFAAHEHTNWLFTQPGVYTMTMRVDVTFTDGVTKSTNVETYTWAVGNETIEQARQGFPQPE